MTVETIKRMMVDCLLRIGRDGCGEGDCYVLCNMDMRVWGIVRDLMIEQDWVTVSKSHFVTLTPAGRVMLAECGAAV